MKNHMSLYGKDYYEYTEFLSRGITYSILISKRLLIRPMIPVWLFMLCILSFPDPMFFAVSGFPCVVLLCVYIALFYPVWSACGISRKAYACFHASALLLIKIASIPISMILEVLWTFCI